MEVLEQGDSECGGKAVLGGSQVRESVRGREGTEIGDCLRSQENRKE
jgi:hypothetical protein